MRPQDKSQIEYHRDCSFRKLLRCPGRGTEPRRLHKGFRSPSPRLRVCPAELQKRHSKEGGRTSVAPGPKEGSRVSMHPQSYTKRPRPSSPLRHLAPLQQHRLRAEEPRLPASEPQFVQARCPRRRAPAVLQVWRHLYVSRSSTYSSRRLSRKHEPTPTRPVLGVRDVAGGEIPGATFPSWSAASSQGCLYHMRVGQWIGTRPSTQALRRRLEEWRSPRAVVPQLLHVSAQGADVSFKHMAPSQPQLRIKYSY